MWNPCCCFSPRIGCFIFGVMDLVVAASTVLWTLDLVTDSPEKVENWIELAFAIFLVLVAILLLVATFQSSSNKLRIWIFMCLILVLVFFTLEMLGISKISIPRSGERFRVLSSFFGTIWFLYQIWVIHAFTVQLNQGPKALKYCPVQIV